MKELLYVLYHCTEGVSQTYFAHIDKRRQEDLAESDKDDVYEWF